MSRTLTAGAKPEPRQQARSYVDCAEVVAGLWITLGNLWRPGRRYGAVLGLMADTRAKLADPALRDHPKRPAAEARMEGWRLELRRLEQQAEPYRKGVARQWDGIPERVRRFLRDSGGWPEAAEAGTGRDVANALWKMAVEGKPWPNGECPFVLLIGLSIALRLGGIG